ncbi:zinc finger and BTB domain-containing protein 26-like [Oncorhynchus keta]|uniref:zinc finger and BTB domain-containing protein 26-like n=1 Tax=Oncorhynchus keta TaxID=8018 RepID=UPI0015FAB550|nr:zinc finger and BTB domain-containing protein 26-like [Oncorhynchus keta]XP_035591545.1 zinc finger and BTB domain-containing protein 26-like [Oncorhynchus keta]XP_052334577.1 zinc finger and BTB domain-containing protein 26-like [Oncorhynchus keta]
MSMAQQQNQVILQFHFGTFGDSMLQKMNLLRHQTRFCDVTVRINDLEVPGHKVVLAAGSPFLRDQFFLQDSSTREVQISMIQEAEVGHQLLLSCYTGTLELPEIELVNYLTVASFLQMGHVVEQCTQALKKFIQPRPCQVKQQPREEEEDGETLRASHAQRLQELPQAQVVHCEVEEDDEDDDDDVTIQLMTPPQRQKRDRSEGEESPITIVKVESVCERVSEMSERPSTSTAVRFPTSPPLSIHSPEPQHSLINSTVDTRASEMTMPPMPGYPLSPLPLPTSATGRPNLGGHLRNSDKSLQWYHQCPKCARVFRQLENYANHLKMHKMFMCLLCGKMFTQKGNLHRHMRVHAGIKPFQCKICGKTFTQKCSLLDHLNLHSGDKPHRCNYCDMVFAHKPVLRKHLKQIHGKNSFDNANERSQLHNGILDFEYGRLQDCSMDNSMDNKPVLVGDSL